VTFQASHSPYYPFEWSVSDSSLAEVQASIWGTGYVIGRAAGTVTVTAIYQTDTAHATLVIREARPGEWESIDLRHIDDSASAATAINDDGTIIGEYRGNGYWAHAFVYRDGVIRKLQSAGGIEDLAVAIGASGTIAGNAYNTNADLLEVWESPDAAPRTFVADGGPHIIGVNERGDVLVTIVRGQGEHRDPLYYRALLWRDGVPIDLGRLADSTIDNPWTMANGWNRSDQIVGKSEVRRVAATYPSQVFHPFLWDNGVMRDLGTLAPLPCPNEPTTDCSWGEAVAINNHGVVVGNASGADGTTRGFIWENGAMRDLGVTGEYTKVLAINDRGQVLGRVDGSAFLWENGQTQFIPKLYAVALGANGEIIGSWANHAFVWQAGQLTDLGDGDPYAINSRGEVVGWSDYRAMLWRKKQ